MNRRELLKILGFGALVPFIPQVAEPAVEKWHHYAVSCNGREVRYYLDGERVGLLESEGLAAEHWQVFDDLFEAVDLNERMCAEVHARGELAHGFRLSAL